MKQNILDKIVVHKKQVIKNSKKHIPEKKMRQEAEKRRDFRPLGQSLKNSANRINIIAEIKRASPSAGSIAPDLDAAKQAVAYERGGAMALSVLTDTRFFSGNLFDLTQARLATALPVLRKDFIISEYQIYESAAIGADAVLLITCILTLSKLKSLLRLARKLGMDALVEVYTEEDMEKACKTDAGIIGINNRNLNTFETDVNHARKLTARLSEGRIVVCASGIRFKTDITDNMKNGINNFLIGEALVRSEDPAAMLRHLTTI
ncbi:MAG: indole-3-glycerol phosphate synthase TrpC [Deltaproteobacteria bacterium]|nr:indole-3-glycerol phosphate synthase TrpC [Deltaproteobacteria bacterium]